MADKRKLTKEEIEILKEKVKEGELELSLEDLDSIAGGVYTKDQFDELVKITQFNDWTPREL